MSVCQLAPLSEALLATGFCAGTVPVDISEARSIDAIGPSEFVALERGTGSVVLVEDLDFDGIPETRRNLVTETGLNHGFVLTSSYLYASTSSDVFRWEYDPVTKTIISEEKELVIFNMNDNGSGDTSQGRHFTRTLVWESVTDTLYVSVGSADNVDVNSFRARIRRFPITETMTLPIDFVTGEVFADGIRNEVALGFSPKDGSLWGAVNAGDLLFRADLGGAIYNDNPAEELHRFSEPGQVYGYPYCWREYSLPQGVGRGRGTAWAYTDSLYSDQECRRDFDSPVLCMQAHSAPLGLTFYKYENERPSECEGVIPFPPEMDGYVFIAFHGSWNRVVPTGYKVVYVPVTEDGTGVVGGIGADPIDLIYHEGDGAQWTDGFRPVDVSFDACGRLLLSSDGTSGRGSKIVRIESTVLSLPPTPAPEEPGFFEQFYLIFLRFVAILRRLLG